MKESIQHTTGSNRTIEGVVIRARTKGLPMQNGRRTNLVRRLAVIGALAFAGSALAQDDAPPTDPPPADESGDAQAGEAPPSLDELLGLEPDESEDSAREAADRAAQDELNRRLREEEANDAFKEALEKMTIAANLLDQDFDPGLGTQRIQEEILAKLDTLIDLAQQNQSNQSSSSSSSSSSQQQQQQPQQQQSNQQQQQQQQGDQQNQNGDNRGEREPPPRQDGVLAGTMDETRSEWGSLPERIREQMQQGMSDQRSSLYRALTEEYYRRLAEESSG